MTSLSFLEEICLGRLAEELKLINRRYKRFTKHKPSETFNKLYFRLFTRTGCNWHHLPVVSDVFLPSSSCDLVPPSRTFLSSSQWMNYKTLYSNISFNIYFLTVNLRILVIKTNQSINHQWTSFDFLETAKNCTGILHFELSGSFCWSIRSVKPGINQRWLVNSLTFSNKCYYYAYGQIKEIFFTKRRKHVNKGGTDMSLWLLCFRFSAWWDVCCASSLPVGCSLQLLPSECTCRSSFVLCSFQTSFLYCWIVFLFLESVKPWPVVE